MAIALVGTPTTIAGALPTSTSVALTVPTGSNGDLVIFHVAVSSNSSTTGAPAITSSTAGLTRLYSIAGTQLNTHVFYRFVQAGDVTSYTFTINVGAPLAATCARYSGVSATTPFRFINVSKKGAGNQTDTAVTFAALDNVTSTDLVLVAVAMGTAATSASQATALSTPASWTNVVNSLGPTSGTTYHTAMALYSRVAATDTPAPTGSSGTYAAISVALIDDSTTGTPSSAGAITFVNAASTGQSANSSTIVVNVPSGVVDGHFLLAAAASPAGNQTWTAPAGWTPLMLANSWTNAGTTSLLADIDTRLWYRFASSEPASYTFTSSSGATLPNSATIVAYSGVRNPYPIYILNVTKTEGSGSTISTTSPTPYVLSTMNILLPNALVLSVYAVGADSTGLVTMTPPSGTWNQRVNVPSTLATNFNTVIAIVDKVAATDQPTATSSATGGWVVYTLALVGKQFIWEPPRGPNYRR